MKLASQSGTARRLSAHANQHQPVLEYSTTPFTNIIHQHHHHHRAAHDFFMPHSSSSAHRLHMPSHKHLNKLSASATTQARHAILGMLADTIDLRSIVRIAYSRSAARSIQHYYHCSLESIIYTSQPRHFRTFFSRVAGLAKSRYAHLLLSLPAFHRTLTAATHLFHGSRLNIMPRVR